MSKQRDYLLLAFVGGIFLLMLHSMNAWFLWNVDRWTLDVLVFIIGFVYYLKHPSYFNFKKNAKVSIIAFSLAILWNTKIGVFSFLTFPLSFFLLLGLDGKHLNKMLRWWTNLYAFILAVSLVGWALSWTGALPAFGTITHPAHDNYTYTNYLLCIRGMFYDIRFNSIFLEPGHTAMIAAFTLFANKFDFKNKAVITILVCTVFTFSLAGYVLTFIGYWLNALQSLRTTDVAKKILPYAIFLIGVYIAGTTYNNGNNLFNQLILERMQTDDENGFVGNNRTGEMTDGIYEDFLKTADVLSGMPPTKYKEYVENGYIDGAGYKIFIMSRGLIGLLLVWLAYYSLYKKAYDKRLALCMLGIYICAFWQRAYPFWYSWMVIFLFITSYQNPLKYINTKNKPV